MKTLFGSAPKSVPSQSASGFGALPRELQAKFTQLGNLGSNILSNAGEYFSPMGLTAGELQASQMIDPTNFASNIQNYLNPYRDVITQDINKAFGDEYSALKSRASEAGAFGSSRMRMGESDLERSRLDAILNALSGQYNTAIGQQQQGISNLLGFGQLERGIDLAQRQAPVNAFSTVSQGLSPLLGTSTGTGDYTQNGKEGIVSKVGKVAGLVGGVAGLFSDARLKENVKHVGEENGFPIYKFNYINDPENTYIGVMAQDVEKTRPDAITESEGFKKVNYDMIGVKMREVNG